MAVPMGSFPGGFILEGFKPRVVAFHVAGMAFWHLDVLGIVSKVVLRGTRNTFARFSEDVMHVSRQAQAF